MPRPSPHELGDEPPWLEDPQDWFWCSSCEHGLYWDERYHGELLRCVNQQCFAAEFAVPIWAAQKNRDDLFDEAANPEGWPRPVMESLPVPYLVPVTAGRPWWRATDGERLLRCQNQWWCQVCGLPLPSAAWVLVDAGGDVSSDAAMHERCLRLAAGTCPHLLDVGVGYRAVQVRLDDLLGDGRPLQLGDAWTPKRWTLRDASGGIG
ncbi:hypothetical protein GCM10029976_066790 [Kribbella albertanoniae]